MDKRNELLNVVEALTEIARSYQEEVIEIKKEFNGLVLEAKANYNIDAEEIEPTLGVTFKF